METDAGPAVVAGWEVGVVEELARLLPPGRPAVTVSPGPPASHRAAVLVPGTADGWARAAAEVERTWGIPRVVVIAPAPVARIALAGLAGPDWPLALDRNLGTATAVSRAFAPGLARRPSASIVLVTWRYASGPGAAHLAAVAGAIQLFALALAADLGDSGITVNAVAVAEDDLAAAGPAVHLLSSPDAGYLTAEALTPRSRPGRRR